MDLRIRKHHSFWYDVERDTPVEFGPGPPPEAIKAGFQALKPPKKKGWF
jgi:hypothetical protein